MGYHAWPRHHQFLISMVVVVVVVSIFALMVIREIDV